MGYGAFAVAVSIRTHVTRIGTKYTPYIGTPAIGTRDIGTTYTLCIAYTLIRTISLSRGQGIVSTTSAASRLRSAANRGTSRCKSNVIVHSFCSGSCPSLAQPEDKVAQPSRVLWHSRSPAVVWQACAARRLAQRSTERGRVLWYSRSPAVVWQACAARRQAQRSTV